MNIKTDFKLVIARESPECTALETVRKDDNLYLTGLYTATAS
jgi:hypothetical protein